VVVPARTCRGSAWGAAPTTRPWSAADAVSWRHTRRRVPHPVDGLRDRPSGCVGRPGRVYDARARVPCALRADALAGAPRLRDRAQRHIRAVPGTPAPAWRHTRRVPGTPGRRRVGRSSGCAGAHCPRIRSGCTADTVPGCCRCRCGADHGAPPVPGEQAGTPRSAPHTRSTPRATVVPHVAAGQTRCTAPGRMCGSPPTPAACPCWPARSRPPPTATPGSAH
jgi:hypothetical protein